MTENMQVDSVPSRQAGFVRCCLKADAELGRLFVMEDSLNSRALGYAISLKLAEENNMTEALFTLGYYWFYIMGENNYETSLAYFERALNNDNSFWANQAMKYYNNIAEYANREFRGPNGQIQYWFDSQKPLF